MARILQEFFHVHVRIAKRGLGFRLGHRHRIEQSRLRMHHAHPATTATTGGLDDDREFDRTRHAQDFLRIVPQRLGRTRNRRYARAYHGLFRRNFIAHDANRIGSRADEHKSGFLNTLRKIGVLGQKTIARMNRFGLGHFRRGDQCGHIQITLRRRRRPDTHSFVSQLHVFRFTIGLGVNHHGFNPHFTAGPLNPQSNFTSIGDENFFKHSTLSSNWVHMHQARLYRFLSFERARHKALFGIIFRTFDTVSA